MGRFTRRKPLPVNIQLLVDGPMSLIGHQKQPVAVSAPGSMSWLEFLRTEFGVKIPASSGIFICTRSYTPTNPRAGEGWRAELNESVKDFIEKFERWKPSYRVRICDPAIIAARRSQGGPSVPSTPKNQPPQTPRLVASASPRVFKKTSRMSTGSPQVANSPSTRNSLRVQTLQNAQNRASQESRKRPREPSPVAGTSQDVFKRPLPPPPRKSGTRQIGRQNLPAVVKMEPVSDTRAPNRAALGSAGNNAEDEDVFDSDEENDIDFDDAVSMMTAMTAENNELREGGIVVEQILDGVSRHAERFSNAFYCRVRSEMEKLQRKDQWIDFVKRSPLAAYLLQELLKRQ